MTASASIPPQIFVINLDESTQRLASIDVNLGAYGLAYARVAATSVAALASSSLPAQYDAETNRKRYFTALKQAEIACFHSHLRAWQLIDQAPQRVGAIVLEDDVRFSVDPTEILGELAGLMDSSEPRIVKLYAKRRSWLTRSRTTRGSTYRPLLAPLGLVAQYVNKAAAHALIAHAPVIYDPVDAYVQRVWSHGVDIRVLRADIVQEVSHQLGGTTLFPRRTQPRYHKLQREIRRPIWRGSMIIRALLHHLFKP